MRSTPLRNDRLWEWLEALSLLNDRHLRTISLNCTQLSTLSIDVEQTPLGDGGALRARRGRTSGGHAANVHAPNTSIPWDVRFYRRRAVALNDVQHSLWQW